MSKAKLFFLFSIILDVAQLRSDTLQEIKFHRPMKSKTEATFGRPHFLPTSYTLSSQKGKNNLFLLIELTLHPAQIHSVESLIPQFWTDWTGLEDSLSAFNVLIPAFRYLVWEHK